MDATEQRREDCRFAVLKALHDRQSGAHNAGTLRTVYMRNHDFTEGDVAEALTLMETAGLVRKINNPAPSFGVSWQITLEGSAAYVRR